MLDASVLFIHGGGADAHMEDAPIVARLQTALGDRCPITYPKMPYGGVPAYPAWCAVFAAQIAGLPAPRILVGHSFGASLLFKYLSEAAPPHPIAGLVSLAAPFWGAEDWEVEAFLLRDDFGTCLPPDLPVILYHSRDDEVVPFGHLSCYRRQLPRAALRVVDGYGHQFSGDLAGLAADIHSMSHR